MALFIPEWVRVSGAERQLKRVLQGLDDDFVIRRPLGRQGVAPELLIEQRGASGWIALAIEEQSFAVLSPDQLFQSAELAQLRRRLSELSRALAPRESGSASLPLLCVLWACSAAQARTLAGALASPGQLDFVSRDAIMECGQELIAKRIRCISRESAQWVLGTYFPETEIHIAAVPRVGGVQGADATALERCFLDPDQEWAAKLDLEVPEDQRHVAADFSVRLINGVAGSGKTLIALHRARLFAERFPQHRVLVLIHNTPIVADLKARLQRARRVLPRNVALTTFFGWATEQWRALFGARPRMPDRRRLREALQQLGARVPELALPAERLLDEIDFINETLIRDEHAYTAVRRVGRGFTLRKEGERAQLWSCYEELTRVLAGSGMRLWSAVPREIALAERGAERLPKYQHIVIDEAQFFAPSWFEVVRRSLTPQGQLFLCADPNQGFLRHRLSWKGAGLDVAGRTKKLRRSYRTTRALLQSASGVLATLGHRDEEEFLAPDFAQMEKGSPPLLIYCELRQQSVDRVVREIDAIQRRGSRPLGSMLVICGEVDRWALYRKLTRALGPQRVWWFNEESQKKRPPGGSEGDHLRMANLETATGLEAELVFLLGIEPLLRAAARCEEEDGDPRREEPLRKLYMALTRAARRLVVVSSERLPPALERAFEVAPVQAPPRELDPRHGAVAGSLSSA